MATKTQIISLAKRIENLAHANTSQRASISVIRIPEGMDRQRVLASHRGRWPVNSSGRDPVLVVWVGIGRADASDAGRGPARSREPSPYCDDVSWREVASEEKLVCRASDRNAQD